MTDKELNIESLLKKSLQPNFEPDDKLNNSTLELIEKMKENSTDKKSAGVILLSKQRSIYFLPKVAAAVIVFALIFTGGVYAANYIMNKVIVTDHGVSVGNEEYIDDEELSKPYESVSEETKNEYEPGADDKWLTKKEVLTNGSFLNTFYTFPDYETMISDTRFENIFDGIEPESKDPIYTITELDPITKEYSIDVNFNYGEGEFHLYQDVIEGNVADDAVFSIPITSKENERNYKAKTGLEYTLVDGTNIDNEKETTVLISYNEYNGYLSFSNLSEDEIHEILDHIVIGSH
ncbi:MAG: hypothetical protein K6F55_11825 [Eubacterium sp.]|nr:hypothetical protein [Eubacterium sp.]